MTENYWPETVEKLQEWGLVFQDGLTDEEVAAVEAEFAFVFPSDLRELLQTALPSGEKFPDWRLGEKSDLRDRLLWPSDGICFDIEHNDFWLDAWGPRPTALEEAFQIARKQVASAPTLIPIYSHRFIPASPHLPGNPIYSVYQTDIIYYGYDLADYLAHEFRISSPQPRPASPRPIEFWDLIVS